MLRLLEKKEVDKLKAEEQRLKIDEGKRLAKRVDNLRELSVDTEASYKSYRDTAIKEIQTEIDAKILEKNELEAVLPALRKERERLENPPDLTEAWEKVSRETEQNMFLRKTLDSKEESLKSESNRLIKLEKEIDILEARKADALAHIDSLKADAQKIHDEAILLLNSNQEQQQILLRNDVILVERLKDVTERESVCESRENDIGIREELAAKKEKDNEAKEIELRRRFQSLESSITSLEKKHATKLKV